MGPDELEKFMAAEMESSYTEATIDHAVHPRNVGSIPDADGFASVSMGDCGDTMEIWVKVRDGRVGQTTFWTDGCGATIACGSVVTEMVKGKPVAEALRVSQWGILAVLGGLPDGNMHCALLAANAMKAALRDYLSLENQPWKRKYRVLENR